jgi:hypothetical protein
MKRKMLNFRTMYLTSVVAIFTCIMIFSIVPIYTASATSITESEVDNAAEGVVLEPIAAFASDGVNYVSTANLLPGDIIVLGTSGTFFDYLIPGRYSHSELYCGVVQSGEQIWDRDFHTWMAVGTPYVIHSTKSDNAGNGVGYSKWTEAVNNHADNILVLRVLKANGATLTASERTAVVNSAKSRLAGGVDGYPIGPAYDINWLSQQEWGDSYYCSELCWAAYKSALGLDLDSNTSPFGIGVSPDDLWHSQFTSVVAGECGSSTFNAPADIVRVSVFVDEVYYDDDYDPWPKGAGEMYLISRSGLGKNDQDGNMLATEQGAPGCGKIGNTPDGYVSRDGAGAVDWNKYFYALCGWNQIMRIRVEAWEDDDVTDGDDQYPVWQWYWSPSTWNAKSMGVWYDGGYRVDLGACRYTIDYKIDIVY